MIPILLVLSESLRTPVSAPTPEGLRLVAHGCDTPVALPWEDATVILQPRRGCVPHSVLREDPIPNTFEIRTNPSGTLNAASPPIVPAETQQGGDVRFIEIADSDLPEITAVAIVKLPPLDSHERAMLGRIVQAIPLGPAEYSKSDLMAVTAGRLVRCEVMADHLMIQVPAFKEQLAGAISVLAELLRNARLDDSSAIDGEDEADAWSSILHGPITQADGYKLRKGDLKEFYQRIFRPEMVTVAVAGPFAIDVAQRAWTQKIAGWEVPKIVRAWPAPEPLPDPKPLVTAFELDGPELSGSSASLASTFLSLFALGCGKGGSLHRLAREKDGLSYRQEAVLWPTTNGWIPRLVVAAADLKDPGASGEELKKQLLTDISQWTEADRLRAVGLAQGVLLRGVPLSPFYFHPNRPITGSPYDRAFMEAYWLAKTGDPWNSAGLAARMKDISLEALKVSATNLLTNSHLLVRKAK